MGNIFTDRRTSIQKELYKIKIASITLQRESDKSLERSKAAQQHAETHGLSNHSETMKVWIEAAVMHTKQARDAIRTSQMLLSLHDKLEMKLRMNSITSSIVKLQETISPILLEHNPIKINQTLMKLKTDLTQNDLCLEQLETSTNDILKTDIDETEIEEMKQIIEDKIKLKLQNEYEKFPDQKSAISEQNLADRLLKLGC